MLDGDPTGRSATVQIASDLALVCSVTELLLAPGVQPDQMTWDQIRQHLLAKRKEASSPRKLTTLFSARPTTGANQ
jgi:hypothetical protein